MWEKKNDMTWETKEVADHWRDKIVQDKILIPAPAFDKLPWR